MMGSPPSPQTLGASRGWSTKGGLHINVSPKIWTMNQQIIYNESRDKAKRIFQQILGRKLKGYIRRIGDNDDPHIVQSVKSHNRHRAESVSTRVVCHTLRLLQIQPYVWRARRTYARGWNGCEIMSRSVHIVHNSHLIKGYRETKRYFSTLVRSQMYIRRAEWDIIVRMCAWNGNRDLVCI